VLYNVILSFQPLNIYKPEIALSNITFLANRVPSLWQSLFFHVTNAFCTYNTAPSTDYGSQVTDCSALALFVVKLSTWFLCSQHFLCQSLVVKKLQVFHLNIMDGNLWINLTAGAYLTIYVICGTLRYLTDDLVTATMHEKLTPLSFAIEPEINVNNSSVTETKRLLYHDKTFSFSTSAIHLVYNLFNEMC